VLLGFPAVSLQYVVSRLPAGGDAFLPPLSIAGLLLFLEPHEPLVVLSYLRRCRRPAKGPARAAGAWEPLAGQATQTDRQPGSGRAGDARTQIGRRRQAVLALLTAFVLFHVLWPLRAALLYPSRADWTGEGLAGLSFWGPFRRASKLPGEHSLLHCLGCAAT
jgi:hypothetical protein